MLQVCKAVHVLTFHQGDGEHGRSWAWDKRDPAQGNLMNLSVGIKEFLPVAPLKQKLGVEVAG